MALDKESKWNNEEKCFDVRSPHALSQVAGYVKYMFAKDDRGAVFFRGQANRYDDSIIPSLFRMVETHETASERVRKLHIFCKNGEEFFERGTPPRVRAPLLQHYGMKTDWIDVVDNVWIALWFACHETISKDKFLSFQESQHCFSYINLLSFGKRKKSGRNSNEGFYSTLKSMEIVDLRISAPSTYVRPHSQHGLLARRKNFKNRVEMDYRDMLVNVLRVRTSDALKWIGKSDLMQSNFLFPSPIYDSGYKILLEKNLGKNDVLGQISYVM